jgi:hypothetical protein
VITGRRKRKELDRETSKPKKLRSTNRSFHSADMATEKQIAANRANARRSTGPRSAAGKKRSANNSIRHGLTAKYSDSEFRRRIDDMALQINGETNDNTEIVLARAAAADHLDVLRVREAKVALIHRVSVTGSTVTPKLFATINERTKHFNAMLKWIAGFAPKPVEPVLVNPADTLPALEIERMAEAARRALPELAKLTRYERLAIARRDRNLRSLMSRRSARKSIARG